MKVHCKKCGTYLGEIRDAKLALKKIVFLCKKCYAKKARGDEEVQDFFKGVFNENTN